VASKIPGGGGEVKLNFKGMGELLRSPAIASELRSRMARVQSALPGSQLEVTTGGRRARAKVIRGSDFDEANTGDLARALDISGGQRGYKVKTNKPRARKASS
jgi:hypothetical protein